MQPPYPPYRQPPYPPYRPYPPQKRSYLLVYVSIAALFLVVAVGVGEYLYFSAKIPPIPVTISSPTPTPTPTPSTPTSGEYVDDTTFSNVSFILDYQLANGSYLSDMTKVSYRCGGIFDPGTTPEYETSQAVMSVDGSSVTIQVSFYRVRAGDIVLTGKYDGSNFDFTTSSLTYKDSTAPVTLTFTPYQNPPALSSIEAEYQQGGLKDPHCNQ